MHVVESLVPAGMWASDRTHSSVGFEVEHMGVSIFGARFSVFEAELVSGDDGAELRGSVRADSVDIEDEALRAHVTAADFLDAARYPEIRFRSTALEIADEQLVVRGELTIKATTKEIEARGTISPAVSDPTGNERVGLAVEASIDRTEFGLEFQLPMPDGKPALGNDVRLIVSLELIKGR